MARKGRWFFHGLKRASSFLLLPPLRVICSPPPHVGRSCCVVVCTYYSIRRDSCITTKTERETHCCERRVTTGTPRKMAHWIQQTDGGKEEEVVPTADTFWLLPLSFLPCALTRAHLLRHKLRHGPMGGVGGVGGG